MSSTSSQEIKFSAEAVELWTALRERIAGALADQELTSDFERFCTFIQNPTTLKAVHSFFKASRCSLLPKPSPRTFLAAFMIKHFPGEILEVDEAAVRAAAAEDDEKTAETPARQHAELDVACMDAANEVVNTVVGDTQMPLHDVLTTVEAFQGVFGTWKEHDRQRLLRELGNTLHQWLSSLKHLQENSEDSKSPESIEVMLKSVHGQIEATKRRILQLGGPDALDEIMVNPPKVIDLEQLIQEVGSKKFWDEFAEELRATPPKLERIGQLLSEIRDRLKALVPNNAERQNMIHTDIDVDFIRQVIHFGSFDGEAFLKVFNSIWTHIKNMQAAADDAEWTQWRDQVVEQASSGKVTWDMLLPRIFNKFLVRLDHIEEATRRFRDQMNAQRSEQAPVEAPASS